MRKMSQHMNNKDTQWTSYSESQSPPHKGSGKTAEGLPLSPRFFKGTDKIGDAMDAKRIRVNGPICRHIILFI
jgi:hypothetical protein